MERQTRILAAVASHLLLTTLHGLVHVDIPIIPNGRTMAFATVSLYLLPVAGADFAVSGHPRVGGAVLLSAGIASFVFEVTLHFLISNPDHVAHVAAHHTLFGVTAILTAMGDLSWLGQLGSQSKAHCSPYPSKAFSKCYDFLRTPLGQFQEECWSIRCLSKTSDYICHGSII